MYYFRLYTPGGDTMVTMWIVNLETFVFPPGGHCSYKPICKNTSNELEEMRYIFLTIY